eukprot:12240.XXX_93644_93754_1 [CDS] Oithona nana genome sequencing.
MKCLIKSPVTSPPRFLQLDEQDNPNNLHLSVLQVSL